MATDLTRAMGTPARLDITFPDGRRLTIPSGFITRFDTMVPIESVCNYEGNWYAFPGLMKPPMLTFQASGCGYSMGEVERLRRRKRRRPDVEALAATAYAEHAEFPPWVVDLGLFAALGVLWWLKRSYCL